MASDTRNKIAKVALHYQNAQATGLKDVRSQLEIFTSDCVFMSFASATVIGKSGVFTYKGIDELREAFYDYNKHIEDGDNIDYEYFDLMIDEDSMSCSFNLLLEIRTGSGKPAEFFNTLQLFLNSDFKVYKAYNWQGDASSVELFDLLQKKS